MNPVPQLRRLVPFVEGPSDRDAVPILLGKIVTALDAWDCVIPDPPFVVGGIENLTGKQAPEWLRYLAAARKRPNFGGVLLLLDGDAKAARGKPFCAAQVARQLAEEARAVGAGSIFSVAVVFARQEFESWLIASYESLPGHQEGIEIPLAIEEAPRDAKKWLRQNLPSGYRESTDQADLTRAVEIELIQRPELNMRSFRRCFSPVGELVTAFRSGTHVATPSAPPPAEEEAAAE